MFLRVRNMTSLFTKEMLLYSLFDYSLKKPLRVVFLGYLFLLFFIWSLPLAFLFSGHYNVYTLFLIVGIPFLAAYMISQPIWGGKRFSVWLRCQLGYMFSNKVYCDRKNMKSCNREFVIDHQYSVSRRKDYQLLANMVALEKGGKR